MLMDKFWEIILMFGLVSVILFGWLLAYLLSVEVGVL